MSESQRDILILDILNKSEVLRKVQMAKLKPEISLESISFLSLLRLHALLLEFGIKQVLIDIPCMFEL